MPHQVHERKFGRTTDQRLGMLRNLTVSVLRYERVKTTEAKAKEIRRFVDRMINLGKDGTLSARRRALAWLPEKELVEKLFTDLPERYPDRRSGYLRMTRVGHRVGDAAPVVQLELVPSAQEERKVKDAAEEEAQPRRRLPFRRGGAKKEGAEAPQQRKKAAASKGKEG
ncbi:MAG: 50S ribosomal protein L17 [Chloroflexi bacterium]|nr:50S ribosomal protein L17 [Chloroflexota bacterium]